MSKHDYQPGTKVSVTGIHFGRQDGIVITVSEATYGIRFSWSDHTLFVLKERVTFRGEPTYWNGDIVTYVGDLVRDSQGNPFIFLGTKGGLPEVTPYGEDAATTVNHIYSGVIVPKAESKEEPKRKLEFGDRFAVVSKEDADYDVGNARSYFVFTGNSNVISIKDYGLNSSGSLTVENLEMFFGAYLAHDQSEASIFHTSNDSGMVLVAKASKWDGEINSLKFGTVAQLEGGRKCVIADDEDGNTAFRSVIVEGSETELEKVAVSDLRPADYDFPYYFGQKVYSTNNKTLGVFIEPVSEGLVSIAIQDEHGIGKIVNVALNDLSSVSPAFTYVNEHSDETRNFGDVVRSDDYRYIILNVDGDTARECTGCWYGIDDNGDEVYNGQYN